MCGRFVLSSDADRLVDHYGLAAVSVFSGGYNVAPSAQGSGLLAYNREETLKACAAPGM